MKNLRIYLDTSVFGGCFDDEFSEDSKALFDDIKAGKFMNRHLFEDPKNEFFEQQYILALRDAERYCRGLELLGHKCSLLYAEASKIVVGDQVRARNNVLDPFMLISLEEEDIAVLVLKYEDRNALITTKNYYLET